MSRSGSSASSGLRAEIVSRQTKIGSSAQVRARLFGRNVSVGLRDVIDARAAVAAARAMRAPA